MREPGRVAATGTSSPRCLLVGGAPAPRPVCGGGAGGELVTRWCGRQRGSRYGNRLSRALGAQASARSRATRQEVGGQYDRLLAAGAGVGARGQPRPSPRAPAPVRRPGRRDLRERAEPLDASAPQGTIPRQAELRLACNVPNRTASPRGRDLRMWGRAARFGQRRAPSVPHDNVRVGRRGLKRAATS